MVFDGTDKEYQARLDDVLDGPMVGLWKKENGGSRELVSAGIMEHFLQLTRPFLTVEADHISEGMRRERKWHYPHEVIREVVINALAHRDWTRSVDIEISVYRNRMEVISPGGLQNSMTVEKMIAGQRSPRNPMIVEVLRDYGYVDARGMGIRTKVIPLMRKENATEPVFEATDDYVKTVLFRRQTGL
jgi:ATP-dependent DNA helicase RecG